MQKSKILSESDMLLAHKSQEQYENNELLVVKSLGVTEIDKLLAQNSQDLIENTSSYHKIPKF